MSEERADTAKGLTTKQLEQMTKNALSMDQIIGNEIMNINEGRFPPGLEASGVNLHAAKMVIASWVMRYFATQFEEARQKRSAGVLTTVESPSLIVPSHIANRSKPS